ncbi:protein IWS1 homolog [Phyllopteryx taeniolatus]|uniref:protein IWS1 homolog n=1 Tax=Phyllopteryx taeniolatus TaxID=161469 RepID=UPI002AD5A765|nr:protein IWS1 homolog [Phyllopteryx taeniolatus]XP_061638252.1 protein IWS1 homolog [Phyllopteryx taeniolatus]XP_061638253.1 protein IWS1 homolog [Phyllopteryx taeniolatus]XP_061638254.1 protein IWS1 homolog [Phyllopteryx taeniolatus]XP_061638255.1 protein IWS1 homolog [Phyllopteryx taeniolatus]
MDGEEDDFMSGSHSDDGGGTPVQDEHLASDGEDASSNKHRSEDEGSDDEDASYDKRREDSDSDDARRDAGSDSEAEAPVRRGDDRGSGSDEEPPRPAVSDDDSVGKRGMSASADEAPVKRAASDDEEGEASSSARRRGSGSDREEDGGPAAASDSDNEDAKAKSPADSDSDTETPARHKAPADSGDESDTRPRGGDERAGGERKAVVRSDSDDDDHKEDGGGEGGKDAPDVAGSDGDAREARKTSDNSDDDDDEPPVKRKKAVLSDSDEDERAGKAAVKRSRAVSDDDSDSDGESGGIDKSMAAKLRELGSDSGSDDDGGGGRAEAAAEDKDEKALFGSDSDDDDNQEEKMIADIFGESGDEDEEEFTGFNQEDLEGAKKEAKEKRREPDDSDSDEGVRRRGQDTSFMSDFDIMLARKKAMSGKRRRHRDGGTFISDADDVVSAMIAKMNEAAEEDRTLNSAKKPALKKLTLLPQVVMHLKKQDLKETFIDSGVMSAIKEWISPLPDKSLPALRIREELLRILQELPSVSQETLKHSGIGRAVMFLYKHPKESRSNKDLALKLINEWSRPIFGLTSDYKGMTREERQQRDLDQQMPQRRRLSSGGQTPRRDLEKQLTGEEKALRPGDPGFCARARVPMPSNKDYVVRPKWNVEMESSRGSMKKGMSRVDKQMRRFADIRRLTKTGHAVKISVEGNRMPL